MKSLFITIATLFSLSLHATTLTCTRTEPFWGAKIDLDSGLVKISDTSIYENGATIQTKILPAAGTTVSYAFVAKGKYTSLAVVENSTCSHGMSEDTYQYSVIMTGYTSVPFVGCCTNKK